MRYDDIHGKENLEEIWTGLAKWLDRFVPGGDRDMFGSTAEMNQYIEYWVSQLRKLAARYRDENGRPIRRGTLGNLPLPVIRMFMSRVMQLPDGEIDALLDDYNRHPLTVKSDLSLSSPLSVDAMSSSLDTRGQPNTISNYFKRNSASGKAAIDVEKFIDSLIAAAATRKMEIDYLRDQPRYGSGQTSKQSRSKKKTDAGTGAKDKVDDVVVTRIAALNAAIEQLLKMQESADPGGQWSGGLSEGVMRTLAMIAESTPDVYSIVAKAHSQGHDPETIKQMLKSLQYPTGDVDRIVAQLSTKTTASPTVPRVSAKPPTGDASGTIYVNKKGTASYDRPSPPVSASIKTGDAYVDGVINDTLARHGKAAAIKAAVMLLQKYQSKLGDEGSPRRRQRGHSDVAVDAMRSLMGAAKWLQGQKLGTKK